MGEMEYRATFDIRAKDDGGGFSGYVATFNKVDSYGTAFSPSAFTKTLQERRDRIPVLLNHDPAINVGLPDTLETDATGLRVEASIFDDGADGTTLTRRLRAGARYGLSFGFRTLRDRAATDTDELDLAQVVEMMTFDGVRVIEEIKLYEVSVVTFPANDAAQITAVRRRATADALTALLDDLREHRLSDEHRDLVAQIVAAFPESPDGTAAPRPEMKARRLDAEIALARMRYLTPEYLTG